MKQKIYIYIHEDELDRYRAKYSHPLVAIITDLVEAGAYTDTYDSALEEVNKEYDPPKYKILPVLMETLNEEG